MKNIFYSLLIISSIIGCGIKTKPHEKNADSDSTVYKMVKKDQFLLTNYAEFLDHSGLNGASAFLIEYTGKTYAVTARHLIGSAGGVDPEIEATELHTFFKMWKLFPRVPIKPQLDTVIIKRPELNYSKLKNDILILEVENNNHNIKPLQPSFAYPEAGDPLYIIGCSYSDPDCKQNVCEIKFDRYDNTDASLVCASYSKMDLSGFSGAPLLNSKGEVVGVITSGGSIGGKHMVFATSITEIKKVLN